ncbi:hypothetical protein [Flavivirga spongiicola]|uniref:Lipoprotein n=1 Tax=Flavivirga spongiicola TaxID=421621 RepID=A0ABU7XWG5_9FLAO|nr:hypothetical protein [Flavivirga sp. MEBiC05379]MDO5979203.1 hypothetical protein [Flavivirga sp. MEBiC05379]
MNKKSNSKMIKKSILTLLIATLLLTCKSETKANIVEKPLPQYETVKEMLSYANDFYEENGSLKFISKDSSNLHIQVSKPVFQNDLEKNKKEIVKRDIIYVAFQTFAQTDINELTITAVPLDQENSKNYFEEYKMTLKVNRNRAKSILKKYLNSDDFSILYSEDDGLWLPNSNFSKLKFEKLEEVFNDL